MFFIIAGTSLVCQVIDPPASKRLKLCPRGLTVSWLAFVKFFLNGISQGQVKN
jgi:hypothetical protein